MEDTNLYPKIKYDLIPANGLDEVGKVLTHKWEKHNNLQYKYGLPWTDVLSSMKKHLSEFEKGNDYTQSGQLHIAEVAADALILCEYYKIYPQGDNRDFRMKKIPVICCDLDDCIFSFTESYKKRFNVEISDYWACDYNMKDNLKILQGEKDFWVNLPVKTTIPFEISYYVTARSIPIEWTQEAIQKNNLPKAPIITLPWDASKIETLKGIGCEIFIDDKYQTYKECIENGIFCYLVNTPANVRYNVGHHRINSVSDLKFF